MGVFCMVRISDISTHWMEDGAPHITIYGAWLAEFGFEVGGKIVLDITKGQIVIKAVDSED